MTFRKFLVTDATARCCGFPMKRQTTTTILREPAVAVELVGYKCQVCARLGVTERDIEKNARRVLLVAHFVKPAGDTFRLMQQERRDSKPRGSAE